MVINIRQFLMLVLQIRHINQGDQLPTVEQSHAVANFLHLVQVVGREQDGQSLLPAQLPNELDELLNTGRVYSRSRFIQDYNFRIFDKHVCQPQSLAHTARIFPGLLFHLSGKPQHAPSAPAP